MNIRISIQGKVDDLNIEIIENEEVDAETYAAIAAAVAAALRRPARIRRVTFVRNPETGWASRGRTTIHKSHVLNRKG